MINLPFKLDLIPPSNKPIKTIHDTVNCHKELAFAINRIYKTKLRSAFATLKNPSLSSPFSYFKFILASNKKQKKQGKVYPTYNPQQLIPQTNVPKTIIFNTRVKNIKTQAFLKLKLFSLQTKNTQIATLVHNRQNQLFNHFIPKIQQKIYTIVFKAIADFAKNKKGKSKIVTLIDKLQKNIIKRVHFSDFFNKLKTIGSKSDRKMLGCLKITKILKLSQKFILENTMRKLESYHQSISLENKLSEKKDRISRIHEVNSQRTVTLQKQRETLRNLKYKLDQESVQKNHILTEKRRTLVLARTKFNEESKQLTQQIQGLSGEVYRLKSTLQKQSHIFFTLESHRNNLKQLGRRGINFESITLTLYKAIYDAGEEGLEGFQELVKHHEQKWNHVEGMVLFQTIEKQKDWQGRMVAFLEKFVRVYERKQGLSEFVNSGSGSRFKPLGSTASTSQLKFSQSQSSLKESRIVNGQYNPKTRSYQDPPQLIRLKEEYTGLQGFIGFILSKSYEIKIKEAIAAEIQQLSELLASDLKENEE